MPWDPQKTFRWHLKWASKDCVLCMEVGSCGLREGGGAQRRGAQ